MTNIVITDSEGRQYRLDDLESDVGHLAQLLDLIVETVFEQQIVERSNRAFCKRVDALLWIARELTQKMERRVEQLEAAERGASAA